MNYRDITSTDLNTQRRTLDIGNAIIGAGYYKNDAFDSYYAYKKYGDYIVIYTKSDIIVLNVQQKKNS